MEREKGEKNYFCAQKRCVPSRWEICCSYPSLNSRNSSTFCRAFHKFNSPDKRGLTLVEAVIAMAVVALAILACIAANIKVQHSAEATFERMAAIQDAHQVLEQMRNAANNGSFPTNVTSAFNGNVTGFSNLSDEQMEVTYADANANPLDTTVTVTWQENGLRTVSKSLRSLITPRT